MSTTAEPIRFRLRPKQKVFVENKERWSFYVGGLGAGKTFAGAVRSIYYSIEYPGSFGLIGAPTYPMLRDTTQRTFFELLPPQLIANYNKNEAKLILTNGTEILFRSMDQPERACTSPQAQLCSSDGSDGAARAARSASHRSASSFKRSIRRPRGGSCR